MKRSIEKRIRDNFESRVTRKLKRFVGRSSYFGGYSLPPRTVLFYLTWRCNFRCKMCPQYGEIGKSERFKTKDLQDELTLKELKTIIDEVYYFRPTIAISGGEPFLHRNILEFIKYVKSKKLPCSVTTNGYFLGENAKELVESGIDTIGVSLDGPAEIHDRIRGVKGAFSKIIKGIKAINAEKKRGGKERPVLNLTCCVSEDNYLHLDEMIKIAKELNVNNQNFGHLLYFEKDLLEEQRIVSRELFKVETKYLNAPLLYSEGKINSAYINYIAKKIGELKTKRYKIPVSVSPNFTYKQILEYYNREKISNLADSRMCDRHWAIAGIRPNGDLATCFDYVTGNLKQDKFRNLWNNKRFRTFRQIQHKYRNFPGCLRCCYLYRSL